MTSRVTLETERFRTQRLMEFLEAFPEIILLRTVGDYGYRLLHYEMPRREAIDYWPITSRWRKVYDNEGPTYRGWIGLLKALGVNPKEWRKRCKSN